MTGRVHSIQSLGTVDGPGVRCVVFMQGCPMRCICCHNPDTWDYSGGKKTESAEIVSAVLKYKSYFGKKGGITVSGGEPLLQSEFVREVFSELKKYDIGTALDTSGCLDGDYSALLYVTDLVLLDIKYSTDGDYIKNVGCGIDKPLNFLKQCDALSVPVWIRQVIIPGINDTEGSVSYLKELKKKHSCIKKIELLPFRKLCVEKYENLGMDFPLAGTPEASKEVMERLNKQLSL